VDQPLVSVICLCYNHQKYVARSVQSILEQQYRNIEIILVDDASTDQSAEIVQKLGRQHNIRTICFPENQGNCKAFNTAYSLTSGQFVIDLAADDVLLPNRVGRGVEALQARGSDYGINFCDVKLVGVSGEGRGTHFKRDKDGQLLETVLDGDLYKVLIERYYLCPPSILVRRAVMEHLGGYDESLSYEDFDFWVRSSRTFKYCFTDEILVEKRVLAKSHSATGRQRKNVHCLSTAKVCEKALALNSSPEEDEALLKRISYELRWAFITENWEAANRLIATKAKISHNRLRLMIEKGVAKLKPPWYGFWKLFLR
jgi:glycosyltransferase involved in cell wall biosynthesis